MPSKQIEAVKALKGNWRAALAANPQMPLHEWRDMIECWPVLTSEPGAVDYIETRAGGVPAMWTVPKGSADDRVILSLHGGGFAAGSMYTHSQALWPHRKAGGTSHHFARVFLPILSRACVPHILYTDYFQALTSLIMELSFVAPWFRLNRLHGSSTKPGACMTVTSGLRAFCKLNLPAPTRDRIGYRF